MKVATCFALGAPRGVPKMGSPAMLAMRVIRKRPSRDLYHGRFLRAALRGRAFPRSLARRLPHGRLP